MVIVLKLLRLRKSVLRTREFKRKLRSFNCLRVLLSLVIPGYMVNSIPTPTIPFFQDILTFHKDPTVSTRGFSAITSDFTNVFFISRTQTTLGKLTAITMPCHSPSLP